MGGITGLVVRCEPLEILVLNPWHPCLVLLVVVVVGGLLIGLLLLRCLVRHFDCPLLAYELFE